MAVVSEDIVISAHYVECDMVQRCEGRECNDVFGANTDAFLYIIPS